MSATKILDCFFFSVALLLFPVTAGAAPTAGDRTPDVNVTFPPSLLMQNGGPVIDVTNPPEPGMHAAVGDGTTDNTAAFQDVYDLLARKFATTGPWSQEGSYYVYIPNGTYKVNDTIFYRGRVVRFKGCDICHVKFIGQSRAKTIIRLADHSPLFQDPSHPRPVLAYQHADTKFNNGPAGNQLKNLTIDVGKGNPGAVGVMFQGANQTDLRNVSILSEDGSGRYGIWFKTGSVQGYYNDISIEGFDYGIYDVVNAEGDAAFEYLTLKGQNMAGIGLSGGGLSLRALASDQSAHGVTALKIFGSGPQAVLIDSTLSGGQPTQPAVSLSGNERQCFFARNISTDGYGEAVQRAGAVAEAGNSIDEYVTSPAKTLFNGQKTTSLNLPVQDTPSVAWYDPAKDWAVVDDFGSVQDAMNSGKPVVCFKKRHYDLTGDVSVPSSVKFVNFMGTVIKGGSFIVHQAAPEPVLFQDGYAGVRVEAQRDVIERCMGRNLSNPHGLPVTFYIENCNDITTGDQFCCAGQKVFARDLDVEYRQVPQIVVNGGTLWIFGFKTENNDISAPFLVKKGGYLEVLGGYVNMINLAAPDVQAAIVTNIDSSASVTCFTNMNGLYVHAVRETQNGTAANALNTDFPLRGGDYVKNYVIPLYVGRRNQ